MSILLSGLVLADIFRDDLVKSIAQHAPILNHIRVVPNSPGGNVSWVVDGYQSSATTFSEGATFNTVTQRGRLKAQLNFARYFSQKTISGTALRAAESVQSPIFEHQELFTRIKEGAQDVMQAINTDFYAGAGGDALVGLNTAISLTTTYAGLDRTVGANQPFQAGSVVTPGSATAISFALLRSDILAIEKKSGKKPNLAVTTYEALSQIHALYDSGVKFDFPVYPSKSMLLSDQSKSEANASFNLVMGYDMVSFMGVTIIADRFCPAGTLYYMHTDDVYFESHARSAGNKDEALNVYQEENPMPVNLLLKELAITGDNLPFAVLAELQLVVARPAGCGLRNNILNG